jgi:hypothetical protein
MTDTFKRLIILCRERIQTAKTKATIFQEFVGQRQLVTNSYKDIYFGLMNKNCSIEDIALVKELLQESSDESTQQTLTQLPNFIRDQALITTHQLRSHVGLRMLFHKTQIYPGIKAENVIPFRHGMS